MSTRIQLAISWAARLTGSAVVCFVGFMVIGHGGPPNPFGQPWSVQLEFLALLLMLAGYLLGWWREFFGAVLALIGLILFSGTELVVNGELPGGALPWFAIPAVLFLASLSLSKRPSQTTG